MQQPYDPLKDTSLKDKVRTKKLFEYFAKEFSESKESLKKMGDQNNLKLKKIDDLNTIEEFAISSIAYLAYEITSNSLNGDDETKLLLNNGISDKLPVIVAYSLACLIALQGILKEENVILDIKKLSLQHLHLFLILDNSKKRLELIKKGEKYIKSTFDSNDKSFKEWFNNLYQFVNGYIIFIDNKEKKKMILESLKILYNVFSNSFN